MVYGLGTDILQSANIRQKVLVALIDGCWQTAKMTPQIGLVMDTIIQVGHSNFVYQYIPLFSVLP